MQFATTIDALTSEQRFANDTERVFHAANVAIGGVQLIPMTIEVFGSVKHALTGTGLSANTLHHLKSFNTGLSGAAAVVGVAFNAYGACKAFDKGEVAIGFVRVGKAVCHGTLLVLLVCPCPPVQGAVMIVLVGLEVLEALMGEYKEPEQNHLVNNHLRNAAKLATSNSHNPLAQMMTAAEKAAIKEVESICNRTQIVYPAAAGLPHGIPSLTKHRDAQLLHKGGFNLAQICQLLGQPVTIDDLVADVSVAPQQGPMR
jgi:hypothetical protein